MKKNKTDKLLTDNKAFERKLISFVKITLRSASLRWFARNEALKAARVERGLYKCSMCKNLFDRKRIHVDHRIPVIDINKGWTGFDDFIRRLLCHPNNLQCLCLTCHAAKTQIESHQRLEYRNSRKSRKK